MKPIEIDTGSASALDMIPESCGDYELAYSFD
jgi:hypothetical protein